MIILLGLAAAGALSFRGVGCNLVGLFWYERARRGLISDKLALFGSLGLAYFSKWTVGVG